MKKTRLRINLSVYILASRGANFFGDVRFAYSIRKSRLVHILKTHLLRTCKSQKKLRAFVTLPLSSTVHRHRHTTQSIQTDRHRHNTQRQTDRQTDTDTHTHTHTHTHTQDKHIIYTSHYDNNTWLHILLVAMPPVAVAVGSHDPMIAVIVPVTSDMPLL